MTDDTSQAAILDRTGCYPTCPTCDAPYVLRRSYSLTTGNFIWLWQRDCKHKSSPVMTDDPTRKTHTTREEQ